MRLIHFYLLKKINIIKNNRELNKQEAIRNRWKTTVKKALPFSFKFKFRSNKIENQHNVEETLSRQKMNMNSTNEVFSNKIFLYSLLC